MTGQFQSWLFTEITKKLPARVTLAKEIGGLLALSSGTVYKKMRGEVPLSLEEALTLMQHYRVSADPMTIAPTPDGKYSYFSPSLLTHSTQVFYLHTPQ